MSSIYSRGYLIHTTSKEKDKAGESAINEIIEKILKESGMKGFVVNSRIINAFREKIWLLKKKADSMRKKGRASGRGLLDKWKSTTYAFTVYYQELGKAALLQENKELRRQKRILEENAVTEWAKRLKVEEKLQQAFAKSEKSSGFHKKRFKDLARKVARMNKKDLRGPQKNNIRQGTNLELKHNLKINVIQHSLL